MSNWKTVSAEEVYDNPWIKISHRAVKTPNDTDAIYGKVHFKNLAVGIIPVLKDGKIVLVGQQRYTLNDNSWEIPEGGCLLGDNPICAAARELHEETGYKACFLKQVMQLHTSNSVTDETAIIYLACELEADRAKPEHTEKIEIKSVLLEDCLNMIKNGDITDAMSVSALLWYAQHRNTMIHNIIQVV